MYEQINVHTFLPEFLFQNQQITVVLKNYIHNIPYFLKNVNNKYGKEDKVVPRLETQMNLYKENQNLVVNTLKKLIKIELETGNIKHSWNCSIKKIIKVYNKYIEKESLTMTTPETSSAKE